MKTSTFNIIILAILMSGSCKSNKNQEESKTEFVEITKAQYTSENMEMGKPIPITFSELITFTGVITPAANGKALISLPVMGVVDKIYCSIGQHITKQQLLFDISGTELIDLQREFAESAAILKRLKSEYDRINELYTENIGSQKELILAESSYKTEKARYEALKLKLDKIGLDIVQIENGSFYKSFSIKSPINGYIIAINATIGQFIERQSVVAEIVDADQFQLKISVFEKNANKLKMGQNILFYVMDDKKKPYNARLSAIGKAINNETKAIDCYADYENHGITNLANNQFIKGQIVVDSFSAMAVPIGAVIKIENEKYILDLEKETDKSYFFNKIKVTTGAENKEYVELKNLPDINKLIIKGTYNIPVF
jgi:membrane fusion protein, heavy metal efflux system